MTMQLNIGGTYKDVSSAYVNVGGVWKTANNIYTNIGGVWKDASLVNYGEYELLADYIVPSNTTTVTFSGLNIGKGDEIVLVMDWVSSTSYPKIYANGTTTDTSYYSQLLRGEATTITAYRYNVPYLAVSGQGGVFIVNTKLTNNGYFVWQASSTGGNPSVIALINMYGTSTFTTTSITQLAITASSSNSIGTNSRFQLYKIGGAS